MADFILQQKISRMTLKSYGRIANFRKPEKYTLGAEIQATELRMLRLAIMANKARTTKRQHYQFELDAELDVLRALVDQAVAPEAKIIRGRPVPRVLRLRTEEAPDHGALVPGSRRSVGHLRVLNPIFDNQFIYHSYGCRVGKGTTRAADQLQYWMQAVERKPEEWYYLKLDVSKYFYRVDHEVLLGILRKKFKGEDELLWLMDRIINCDHTPFGLPPGVEADSVPPSERLFEVGMPIGNLTSQLLANVCLNELDQFVKHTLKVHHFVRLMDDMVLLLRTKEEANYGASLI